MGSGASSSKKSAGPEVQQVLEAGPLNGESSQVAPETSNSDQQESQTFRRCVNFLKQSTSTGSRTARRSPVDKDAFVETSDGRQKLRDDFVKSLDQLHAAASFTDDSALANLLTVCKMSDLTDTALADELVEKEYTELFLKIWSSVIHADLYTSAELRRQYVAYSLLKRATVGFTYVSCKLCAKMGSEKLGVVPMMAQEFDHPLMRPDGLSKGIKRAEWDSPRETLKLTVTILANIVRFDLDSKTVFRKASIVPHLEDLLKCRFLIMRAKALFCLVYLINEDENEALNTTDDNVKFVIKVLGKCVESTGHYSEHYAFSAEVVARGIANMALNDSNKVKLVKRGVMPHLIAMLKTDSLAEKRTAAKAVWRLAFHDENKETFKSNKTLITGLEELQSSETDSKLLQSCSTVLWMLGVTTDDGKAPSEHGHTPRSLQNNNDLDVQSLNGDGLDDDMPHVMISYQWAVQKQMIKVKERLRSAGYNVWMDIDNMGGSTLESMASAVESSTVVLICFSEKYKKSSSCRTEAEYTYKRQKSIIPLRLQEDYDPDGWLGIMIGTKLYVDLSRTEALTEGVDKLKQLLGERGRVLKNCSDTLKATLTPAKEPVGENGDPNIQRASSLTRSTRSKQPAPSEHTDAKTVSSWSNEEVSAWLTKQGLGQLKSRFDGYTGQRLLGLKTISSEAPDFFFSELKKDLGFQTLLEIVKFKQALDEII